MGDIVNINEAYDNLLENSIISEEEVGKLTEENVNDIISKSDEVVEASDSLKMIKDLKSNNGIETNENPEEGHYEEVTVQINPTTMEKVIVSDKEEPSEEDQELITETFEELLEKVNADDSLTNVELSDDVIKKTIEEQFELKPNEIVELLNVVKEYKQGKTSGLYSRMPMSIKVMIDQNAMYANLPINSKEMKTAKNAAAKELIESFICDASLDQINIDFEKEISAVYEESSKEIKKLYSEMMYEKDQKLRELADKLIAEDKPDKAKTLIDICDAILESYTMEKFKETLKTKRYKIKPFEFEKPEKLYKDFNFKYNNSVYNIYDIGLVPAILRKYLSEDISDQDIVRFILTFIKYTMNMRPENIVDHSYMYYFILNIVSLSMGNVDSDDEFGSKIIENIIEIINMIK